ncbi:secreted protein containing DUF1312 [gut metagenome]|uniref:Secreted protein containing DUF1312 n=1 Tax=gut metagenome TaxID=749906 RepID=J9H016_9ZZZZ
MKKRKNATKTNLIFAGVLLLLALVLFLLTKNRAEGTKAVLTVGTNEGNKTIELVLSKDQMLDIEAKNLTVHVEIRDGRIRFVHSACPDHICEREGWLSKEGDTASCLPAPASILVVSGE